MYELLTHPEQLELLKQQPELCKPAVEELLRYTPAVPFMHRVVAEDLELRGRPLRKGQLVFLGIAAANRDPDVFADPDRFDITRQNNKYVAFAFGPHLCLGAGLARRELELALRTLLPHAGPPARRATAPRLSATACCSVGSTRSPSAGEPEAWGDLPSPDRVGEDGALLRGVFMPDSETKRSWKSLQYIQSTPVDIQWLTQRVEGCSIVITDPPLGPVTAHALITIQTSPPIPTSKRRTRGRTRRYVWTQPEYGAVGEPNASNSSTTTAGTGTSIASPPRGNRAA